MTERDKTRIFVHSLRSDHLLMPPESSSLRPPLHPLAAEAGRLGKLAGPIVLSQLGAVAMGTMDVVMVGQRLGPEAVAAAGLGNGIVWFGLTLAMGTLAGMGPLVSQAFGAGRRETCREVLVQGLWLALLLSLPALALTVSGGAVVRALGQPAVLVGQTTAFMRALAPGIVPFLLYVALRNYLEGMGRPQAATVVTVLGIGLNYIGNRVLISGVPGLVPPLGLTGSGLTTSTVRWLMLAALAGYALSRPDLHPFEGVSRRANRRGLGEIVRIGLPAAVTQGAEVGIFVIALVMMGWIGVTAQSAHTVVISIASATFMVGLGVSIAGSIRVGQLLGADDPDGARRAVVLTYIGSVGLMGLCGVLFLSLPGPLLGFYTAEPEVLRVGAQLLALAALFQIFDGAQVAGAQVLRGAADTKVPMLLALVAYWGVGLPVGYGLAFSFGLGAVGIWIGLTAALMVAAVLLGFRVRRTLWPPTVRQPVSV